MNCLSSNKVRPVRLKLIVVILHLVQLQFFCICGGNGHAFQHLREETMRGGVDLLPFKPARITEKMRAVRLLRKKCTFLDSLCDQEASRSNFIVTNAIWALKASMPLPKLVFSNFD